MTPEHIAAIGGAIVAVLTAVFGFLNARQARKTDEIAQRYAELQQRVERLEQELARTEGLLRAAVRYIRELLAHITRISVAHRLGETVPDVPPIPEMLKEEI
ncbi:MULTISPECIES: hypothetical protein [unclassified Nocardia]|uniref:hypothetical protein n=1 Tax=unclassified Nocardia TaxID=2637762 RepID=UPI00278BD5FC|nr:MULTISPECIES: hypothetical protein [unclassified Nocardia]